MDVPTGRIESLRGQDGSDRLALTPANLFVIDYIAPPPALGDYITTLYHFRCDEPVIRDIQPAAIGQLAIFPHGVGAMQFRDGRIDSSHETNLLTPFSVAAPFFVDGPFHAIGAVLSTLGWAALTGLDASQCLNRLVAAGDWLGDEVEVLGATLCQAYREGQMTGRDCAAALCDHIGQNLRPVNARHADLIRLTSEWLGSGLNPPLASLMQRAAYSERQVQRLVERYFGLPPQALARKYRALRSAALLSLPTLTPEWEAQLAEAFFDQSHMIREINLFVGRTPARLGDDESPYLHEMLDPKNLREIRMPKAWPDSE